MQEDEIRNFEVERIEIAEICQQQGRSDEEKDEFLNIIDITEQQVKQDHLDQLKELRTVQTEDLVALKREQKRYRQEVKRTAPDTILYVYAKTKKEKERKKEKKLLESRSKDNITMSTHDPEHHIGPSTPGGPTRSTSAMMIKKKKVKPPLKSAETTEKIRTAKTRSQKSESALLTGGSPRTSKRKRYDMLPPVVDKENTTSPAEPISDPDEKVKTPNGELETEEFLTHNHLKINEDDNTQI